MMMRFGSNPFRLLLTAAAIILLALAPVAAQERDQDPNGQMVAESPHGTVTVNARTKVSVDLQKMGGRADSNLARLKAQVTRAGLKIDPDGPVVWTDGTKICVASRYGLTWHWNHAGGSDGLPRVAMRPVGDHYELDLDTVPTEDFTFGFCDANQSDGVRETKWLPGNVAFKKASPWVVPHPADPGCDFLMKVAPGRMWVADPDEVKAYRRAKLAQGH